MVLVSFQSNYKRISNIQKFEKIDIFSGIFHFVKELTYEMKQFKDHYVGY